MMPARGAVTAAVALLCFLSLAVSSRAAPPPRFAAGLTVENGTGDASLDWLARAFEYYFDYALDYHGSPPPSTGPVPVDAPVPVVFTVEYNLEGERVVFSVAFHVDGDPGGSQQIIGPLAEAAVWLAGTGKVLEVALPRGVSPGEGMPPPTASTEALRRFAASDKAVGMREKERLLEEALELDPSFHDALFRIAVTAAVGERYDEACSLFTRYLEHAPGNVPALRNAAVCLAAAGRQTEAADLLRKVIDAAPGDRRARYGLARVLRSAGSPGEAGLVYEGIIEDFPHEGEAFFEQILLRVSEGDLPGARGMINDLSPERLREAWSFFYLRGQEELGAGRIDSSLGAFSMAGLVDPDNIQAGLALGAVSYQKGDFEYAVRRFQEVLRVRQGDPEIYRYLAMAFERLGDQGTALDYYRKSTEAAAEGNSSRWAKDLFLGSMSRGREASRILPILATPFSTGFSSQWIEGSMNDVEVAGDDSAGTLPPSPADIPEGGSRESRPGDKAVAELEREIAGYRAQNSALAEQIRQKEAQAVSIAREALAAQKSLREAQARIADIEGRLKEKEEGAASLREGIEERVAEQESELSAFRGREADLEKELARLRSSLVESEELRRINARLAAKVRDIVARLVRLSSELEDREREIGRMKSRLEGTR